MPKLHTYEGQEGVVTYDAKRCIHVAECVHGLPAVFDPNSRPWVSPDGAGAEELASVIARCPTGALHFERADGLPAEPVPGRSRVILVADGPLYVHGQIEIAASDGTVQLVDTRVALCRCGASENKPFCDGSHTRAGFRASGTWEELTAPAGDPAAEGPLRVICRTDGPLLLQGPFTLTAADGTSAPCARAAACRCGASENRPFCDGSHSAVGFTAA